MNLKVLIIAYYWPPAGGPGVQRWLKFVKYLPEFGVKPIVFVPDNPTYPIIDEVLLQEVPSEVQVIRFPIREPYALAGWLSKHKTKSISSGLIPAKRKQSVLDKFLLWVRGNFFIPDARISWVKPSLHFLENYLKENPVDVIITTGPPHSLHLIGLGLKEQLQLPWLVDFRDPWTTIGYHQELKLSKKSQNKHLELEKRVLQSADMILVTSPTTAQEFSAITSKPIEVITNGFDDTTVGEVQQDEAFTLAHIGSFLSDRNPRILWKALRELRMESPVFKSKFRLKLVGKVSQDILDTLEEFRLTDTVDILGYLPHKQAVEEQKKSQVLLLVEINKEDTRCILPGKLFEYMASGRPILAFGPEGSDMEPILKTTYTGCFFTYDSEDVVKNHLQELFQAFEAGILTTHPIGVLPYHRRTLTKKLAQLLHEMVK
jgi:glycosyltransferase involved in cell wall biosynthesis